MGAVRVHLDEGAVPAVQRPVEAGDVGGTDAGLACPVQHMDLTIRSRELVGDLTSAVWAVVIDHEDIRRWYRGAGPRHDRLQVAPLVEGRDDDGHPADRDAWSAAPRCVTHNGSPTGCPPAVPSRLWTISPQPGSLCRLPEGVGVAAGGCVVPCGDGRTVLNAAW